MREPSVVASRYVGLDQRRTLRVAALETTDRDILVVIHTVGGGNHSLVCSFKPERLRPLAER